MYMYGLYKDSSTWNKKALYGFKKIASQSLNRSKHGKMKSRKYRGIFKVKSREKTRQARGNWSQLKHKRVAKGTEPGLRKGKRSLLTCKTRCKWSMETIRETGLNNWSISKSQKEAEPGVEKGKHALLACNTVVNVPWKTIGKAAFNNWSILSKSRKGTNQMPEG